ncbi:MAG: ArsA family ATPase [Phycisphaerales bacterium]
MTRERPNFLANDRLALLVFGGKGGVGKTSCAAATAIRLSRERQRERIVLVSFDPAHSVRDCLGGGEVPANLDVVEFDAPAFHEAFLGEHGGHLRSIAERGTFLDGADVDSLMDLSMPGVDELMGFLQLAAWIDRDEYDTYIVDTAPTGHALRLLAMPEVIGAWLEAVDGLLAKHRYMASVFGGGVDETEAFLEMMSESVGTLHAALTDSSVCRFVPVMIAEPMSTAETRDLLGRLDELGIAAPELIANRVMPADSDVDVAVRRARQVAELRGGPGCEAGRVLWVAEQCASEPVGAERLAAFADSWHVLSTADLVGEPAWSSRVTPPVTHGVTDAPLDPQRRLLLFAGKGGVGKTTMACAAAIAAANHGRRVTLISTDPAGSLIDCLGVDVTAEPSEILPGLEAMQLDSAEEFRTLRELYRDEITEALDRLVSGATLAFEGDAMRALIDLSPPGLDEVMALTRVASLFGAQDRLIVLDTAPTGHLIRLLELPEVIEQWIRAIFDVFLKYEHLITLPTLQDRLLEISRGIRALRTALAGSHAAVMPVTIATAMSLEETSDLIGSCRRLGVPVGAVIVNQLTVGSRAELTRAMAAQELARLEQYATVVPLADAVRVHRGDDLRGVRALGELADRVFAPVPAGKVAA